MRRESDLLTVNLEPEESAAIDKPRCLTAVVLDCRSSATEAFYYKIQTFTVMYLVVSYKLCNILLIPVGLNHLFW